MSSDASAIEKGYLVAPDDERDESKRIALHFNPVTLTYSVEASASQQNQPNRTGQVQHAAQYSAKLSFDALFDNTDTGEDVRLTTSRVVQFLEPSPPAQGSAQDNGTSAPPLLLFHWGAFRFTGVLTQYRETIDFFAKEGVPLRSTVSLTLVKQDKTLESDSSSPTTNPGGSLAPTSSSDSALSAATRGGYPRSARALARANNLPSLRFTGGATLQVPGIAGGAASLNFAVSATSSGDASASWNASGSGSLFGAQTSAGVAASAGAFSGLSIIREASAPLGGVLNASKMQSGATGGQISAHAGASFSLGGAAQMEVGPGLSADVGARASWRDLLQFDDEG